MDGGCGIVRRGGCVAITMVMIIILDGKHTGGPRRLRRDATARRFTVLIGRLGERNFS